MSTHPATLFGGIKYTVSFEPFQDASAPEGWRKPADEEIRIRQIPVREYETGFAHVEKQDELALVGLLAGKDRLWAQSLTPVSYEEVLTRGREVNGKGFFSFCRRRTEQVEKQTSDMLGLMQTLPPETVKLVIAEGMKMAKPSGSKISSPGSASPQAR
jgi:hypothetical protein